MTVQRDDSNRRSSRKIGPALVRRITVFVAISWTVLFAIGIAVTYRAEQKSARDAATVAARSHFIKDVIYRRWNAQIGGLYAPVSELLAPNAYLADLSRRDVVTTDGQKLTLVNPSFMTRMVHELGGATENIQSHITSLDPIRPENAADEWESQALQAFETGAEEVVSVQNAEGQRFLRLMRPLVTEASCLACHRDQGYEIGDIRGGISVSVPLADYLPIARANFRTVATGYGLALFFGLLVISFGGANLAARVREQLAMSRRVEALLEERELMIREVQHRIKNHMSTMASLVSLKSETVSDPDTHAALREVSDKFKAMMVIYDRLYHSTDSGTVSLAATLPEILRHMTENEPGNAAVRTEVAVEDILVDANTAATLGILTTEAVTNALKYAFPSGASGVIQLRARRSGDEIDLMIRDDGMGFSGDGNENDSGLGLPLIRGLAQQLGGTAEISGQRGTTVRVRFPAGIRDYNGEE